MYLYIKNTNTFTLKHIYLYIKNTCTFTLKTHVPLHMFYALIGWINVVHLREPFPIRTCMFAQ